MYASASVFNRVRAGLYKNSYGYTIERLASGNWQLKVLNTVVKIAGTKAALVKHTRKIIKNGLANL